MSLIDKVKEIYQIIPEKEIKKRAYKLWEESDKNNNEEENWEEAKKQLEKEYNGIRRTLIVINQPLIFIEKKLIEPCNNWLNKAEILKIIDKISPIIEAIGVIAIPIVIFSSTQDIEKGKRNQERATRAQQEIQNYIYQISNILLEGEIKKLEENKELRSMIRASTIALLESPDLQNKIEKDRKGQIVRYLSETRLIQRSKTEEKSKPPIISLKGANLKEVYLERADLTGADLKGASLTGANLKGTDLTRVNLTGADLAGADLSEADLAGADLLEADLAGANLLEADLAGANLTGANLTGADLTRANLTGADLAGADFTEADLAGADLTRANLAEADFTEADLTRANIRFTKSQKVNFTEADLTGANLTGAYLTGAYLTGANLTEANLTGTRLTNTKLEKANFKEAYLRETILIKANLKEADLRGAFLIGTVLFRADLEKADLRGAYLIEVDLGLMILNEITDIKEEKFTGAKYTNKNTIVEICKKIYLKHPCGTIFPKEFGQIINKMKLIKEMKDLEKTKKIIFEKPKLILTDEEKYEFYRGSVPVFYKERKNKSG